MSENNFMVENCASLPEGLVSIITTYINGSEGWRRLKQCDALRELQRKWKPSISNDVVSRRKTPEKSITTYNHEIHNKKLKGDKAFSYALNPSEKFMNLIRYSNDINIKMHVRVKLNYDSVIGKCNMPSNQYTLKSKEELLITIEKMVKEIQGTIRLVNRPLVMIDFIKFEIHTINNYEI